jgi:hypothetical protein
VAWAAAGWAARRRRTNGWRRKKKGRDKMSSGPYRPLLLCSGARAQPAGPICSRHRRPPFLRHPAWQCAPHQSQLTVLLYSSHRISNIGPEPMHKAIPSGVVDVQVPAGRGGGRR